MPMGRYLAVVSVNHFRAPELGTMPKRCVRSMSDVVSDRYDFIEWWNKRGRNMRPPV